MEKRKKRLSWAGNGPTRRIIHPQRRWRRRPHLFARAKEDGDPETQQERERERNLTQARDRGRQHVVCFKLHVLHPRSIMCSLSLASLLRCMYAYTEPFRHRQLLARADAPHLRMALSLSLSLSLSLYHGIVYV